MNRRSFLFYTIAATITTGLRAENIFASVEKSDNFSADLSKELTELGSSKIANQIIVVRLKESNNPESFIALSSKCTHRGCKVAFKADLNKFQCPCHKSEYDTNGNVIKGPAKKALQKYTVNIKDSILTVVTDQDKQA